MKDKRVPAGLRRVLFGLCLLLAALVPSMFMRADAAAGAEEDLALARHTWLLRQDGGSLVLEQRLYLDAALARLVRSGPALQPQALAARLLAQGEEQADCQVFERPTGLYFNGGSEQALEMEIFCRSRRALPPPLEDGRQALPLPGMALPGLLADLPVQAAQGLRLEIQGQAQVDGVFVALPAGAGLGALAGWRWSLPGAGTLRLDAHFQAQPGDAGMFSPFERLPGGQALAAVYQPAYFPPLPAWFAFVLAGLGASWGIRTAFPHRLGFWFPEQALPTGTEARPVGRLRLWWGALLQRLARWWAPFFLHFLGLALCLAGGLGLWLAWQAEQQPQAAGLTLDGLAALFPYAGGLASLLEGAPAVVLLASAGGAALLAGVGLSLRQGAARTAARILLLGGAAIAWLVWSRCLLLPEWYPGHQTLRLLPGVLGLPLVFLALRGLNHPQVRRLCKSLAW